MDYVMPVLKWIMEHYGDVLLALLGLVAVAEIVVRFTPTKEDDGFVERLGAALRRVMDWLKIPNRLK